MTRLQSATVVTAAAGCTTRPEAGHSVDLRKEVIPYFRPTSDGVRSAAEVVEGVWANTEASTLSGSRSCQHGAERPTRAPVSGSRTRARSTGEHRYLHHCCRPILCRQSLHGWRCGRQRDQVDLQRRGRSRSSSPRPWLKESMGNGAVGGPPTHGWGTLQRASSVLISGLNRRRLCKSQPASMSDPRHGSRYWPCLLFPSRSSHRGNRARQPFRRQYCRR